MGEIRLQVIAEMIDKISPNVKRVHKAFEDLQKSSAREFPTAFKKYQTAVSQSEKSLVQFTKRSEAMRREIRAFQDIVRRTTPMVFELTQSVGAFATGSGAMVGAIGAVGAALYEAGKSAIEFAEAMKKIKFGSEETGLGKLQLKQLTQALGEFHIDTEAAADGFRGLRGAMTEMNAHLDIFKDKLGSALGQEVFKYANPIIAMSRSGKTVAEVYSEITKQLDRISADQPDKATAMDLRRRLVQGFGLPAEFAVAGEAALREKLDVIKKYGTTPEEMDKASKAAGRFNELLEDDRIILDKWLTLLSTAIIKFLLLVDTTMGRVKDTFSIDKTRQLGILLAPATGGLSASISALIDAWVKSHPELTPFAEGGVVDKPTTALVGEKGPEYIILPNNRARLIDTPTIASLGRGDQVIPARALGFIRGIGRTESGFSRAEAYSDRLNTIRTNRGVRQFGQAGADYGYYQMNQRDVAEAIKLGMDPAKAGHLAGGSQSTFAPAGDVSTLEQQTSAVNEFLQRRYPEQYRALVGGGSFENARKAMGGKWFGLRDKPKEAEREFNATLQSRSDLNAAMGGGVSSSGQLDVNVRAPSGTSVKAEGSGLFKDTNVRRHIQMTPSAGGPPQAADVPYMQRQQ